MDQKRLSTSVPPLQTNSTQTLQQGRCLSWACKRCHMRRKKCSNVRPCQACKLSGVSCEVRQCGQCSDEKRCNRCIKNRRNLRSYPPDFEAAAHTTAASRVLSWRSIKKILGETLPGDSGLYNFGTDLSPPTKKRLINLYMNRVNIFYPILFPEQLKILYLSFSESSHTERALFLLVLALGKVYDYTAHTFIESDANKYFHAATDVMDILSDGNNLCYVQVQILASLYYKQLGQFSKSHATINKAAQVLQVILQTTKRKRDNSLLFAFWTCVILESELIAVLPYSQSNLHEWENDMPLPNVQQAGKNFGNNYQIIIFNKQLLIRQFLKGHENRIGDVHFGDKCLENPQDLLDDQAALSNLYKRTDHLFLFLSKLCPETSGPSSHVLITRLQAKVLAEQANALRPFLDMVLNREGPEVAIPEKARHYARLCIETLQRCTIALNDIKDDRLIVYTQWSNIIILLAAYSNATLKKFTSRQLLKDLVKQTLSSLAILAAEHRHIEILEAMVVKVGLDTGQVRDVEIAVKYE